MKITEYPSFDNVGRNNSLEEEGLLLAKLLWLIAEGLAFISSFNHEKNDWDEGAYEVLLANDTFGYACADAEEFEEKDIDTIIDVYLKFGHDGINAWMSLHAKCEVINPLRTKKYIEAQNYLESNPTDKQIIVGLKPVTDPLYIRKLFWLHRTDLIDFTTNKNWSLFDNVYTWRSEFTHDIYTGFEIDNNIIVWSLVCDQLNKELVDLMLEAKEKFSEWGLTACEDYFQNTIKEKRYRSHFQYNKDTHSSDPVYVDTPDEYYEAIEWLKEKKVIPN